jgi:hypothetical protein
VFGAKCDHVNTQEVGLISQPVECAKHLASFQRQALAAFSPDQVWAFLALFAAPAFMQGIGPDHSRIEVGRLELGW